MVGGLVGLWAGCGPARLLLSGAALLTTERLTIGVSTELLLRQKKAASIIEPQHVRGTKCLQFLASVKPELSEVKVDYIDDPVGTAGTDPQLDCILVSEETAAGGHYCNRTRASKGLPLMEVVVAQLVQAKFGDSAKISSTSSRQAECGKFHGDASEWTRTTPPTQPYVIGITGGIASGKSGLLKALQRDRGVAVVDCDLLGHQAYLPGTQCLDDLVNAFGEEIIDANGFVDRPALAALVFDEADPRGARRRRRKLQSIVWPAVEELVKQRLDALKEDNHEIVLLEAAVLLEANWDRFVDEVWCVCVSQELQCQRVMARNGLSRVDAEARIAAQLTTEERIKRSQVLVVSDWTEDETAAQGLRAFDEARNHRMGLDAANSPRTVADIDGDLTAPLKDRWASLVASIGGNAALTRRWWRKLSQRHSERHRWYHCFPHLRTMHSRLREFKQRGLLACPQVCELALFFHDVIYEPTRSDNEAESAKLYLDFCADLRRSCTPTDQDEPLPLFARLPLEEGTQHILATSDHLNGCTTTRDTLAFLDADLEVLAKPPAEYARYAEQIRLEYAHVDEAAYRQGRSNILRSFLEHDDLFFTPAMRNGPFEANARANLTAEMLRYRKVK